MNKQTNKFNNAIADNPALHFTGTTVSCSNSIHVLGVTIDQHLTFDNHVTKIVQACNYHIRSLRHIRQLIDKNMANTLSCSIVGCRLDYCNALLYGMSQKNVNKSLTNTELTCQTCVQCAIPQFIPAITQIITLVTSHRTCRIQTCRHDLQSSTTSAEIGRAHV
jgi:hypothetical protein